MASIVNDKSKRGYLIRLTERESPTGKRVKITCSGYTKKQTQQVLVHVENIIVSRHSKLTLEQATAEWIGTLQGPIRKRLEDLGLIESVKQPTNETLVNYMTAYIKKRTDIANSTRQTFNRSLHFTHLFFGDRKLLTLTAGDAKDFGRWLREPGRKNAAEGLAENTARKMIDKLKTVFNAAIDNEILTKNPFKGIATSINANEEKQQFIQAKTVRDAIMHAPDAEFAAIIALARFGGLRTPSEFRHLKHGHFVMAAETPTFTIYCQKTVHTGKKTRVAPVFTELRPYLAAIISSDPAKTDQFVFSDRHRLCSDANIYNTLSRVLKNAGIEQWPDLWRNLRASRESELLQQNYNIKDVCLWLGNTPQVVVDHYLRSDPESLRKATADQTPSVGTTGDVR